MEAAKKAVLIIAYKVFHASPKSPDQPNVYLEITYKKHGGLCRGHRRSSGHV
jgi:hypothetical protein